LNWEHHLRDLNGGLSAAADRYADHVRFNPTVIYSATISLPVGAYVQYKLYIGDGFWKCRA